MKSLLKASKLSFLFTLLIAFSITGCNDSLNNITKPSEQELKKTSAASAGTPLLFESDKAPQIGVNYNGQFDMVNFNDLERTQTTWVRGFIDFFQFYPDHHKLINHPRIEKYLALKDNGYKTILNIKWNFHNKSFPDPGSQEMKDYKKYLKKLLDRVWKHTDIIVAGNEPFIESRKSERGPKLVAFYKEVAKEIHEYKKGKGIGVGEGKGIRDVPIYIGAFNNLYWPGWRTDAVRELLAFAEEKPWIAGIDLHIHHGGFKQLRRAINFINNKIRDDQKFLITEYSLVKHFRRKVKERISGVFAEKYGWDPDTKAYQYIDFALKNQVPRKEWVDFLSNSYWFENRKRYLRNSYKLFKSYDKFYIATFAMRQSFPFNRDFNRNTWPWILNGLFANRTVEADPETGQNQFNYGWIEDFLKIQNGFYDN